jgi:hypothetical protein
MVGEQKRAYPPPERPRRNDAEHRHYQRAQSDLHHVADGGFEADLEKEDDCAQLRYHPDRRIGGDELKPVNSDQRQIADEHADDELTEYRGLADPLSHVATELGGGKNDGERQHDRRQRIVVGRSNCQRVAVSRSRRLEKS